jgi:Ca2+-transporting ATPase
MPLPALTPFLSRVLVQVVVGMASKGLRCICLTYTDYPLHDASRPANFFEEADRVDNNLVCCAIVGIKDPVRWVAAGAGAWQQ